MHRKKLAVVMTAAVIGMAIYGGSGSAFAHDGHDQDGAVGQTGSAETANKGELCPVSGEEVDAKGGIAYEYKGKVYHFCCASCIADFKKDPEKYIRKMKGGAAKDAQEPVGHEGHDHGHD
jgi:YHS domain-containing protein